MTEKIHESDYDKKNYHITRFDETLIVDLTYPNIEGDRVRFVEFDQESVRASGGIRAHFDYDRDGYVISQRGHIDRDGWVEEVETWTEVGFFPAFREVEATK